MDSLHAALLSMFAIAGILSFLQMRRGDALLRLLKATQWDRHNERQRAEAAIRNLALRMDEADELRDEVEQQRRRIGDLENELEAARAERDAEWEARRDSDEREKGLAGKLATAGRLLREAVENMADLQDRVEKVNAANKALEVRLDSLAGINSTLKRQRDEALAQVANIRRVINV